MRSTVEPLEGNKVKLTVEVDEDEFERALDAAFRKIAREVRIPGFRPGKAPRRILQARLGAGVGREEALRDSLPDYYAKAVKDHEVDVIAAPTIDITAGEEDGPVAFDAIVEIRPQVDVAGYGGLRVTVPSPFATDEDIDGQLERLREQFGELSEVSRPAAAGDHVSINIQGSSNGEPVPGLTADDYLYEVGSGGIATELDDNLRGAKLGDVLEFDSEHPEPDKPGVHFRVLVKGIKEKVLPDVTDEWANEVSEFDTVEELRADFGKRIGGVRKLQAAMALREAVAGAVASLVEDEAPEPLVDEAVRERLQDLSMRLARQGIDAQTWLQATGRTEQELVAELREGAVEAVKVDLGLRAVAEAEEIECDDDDLEAEYARVAERLNEKLDRVRKEFERNDQVAAVRSDIRKRKALDWLIEHVEIVDESGGPIDRADLEIGAVDAPAGEEAATDSAAAAETSAPTSEDVAPEDTEETAK